jgi:hypothetical protein
MAKVTPIQLYYSTTASATPLAANLLDGELAVNSNTADGKLFYKDSSGAVQIIASRAVANRETTLQTVIIGANSPTLSGVTITGTAGQFSCTASTLAVNDPIVISGTFGGTGSITGYTNPKTYYIIATNGTTTFTLSTSIGGSAITTTAGTPTGLTYTKPTMTISVSTNVVFTITASGFTAMVLLPDPTASANLNKTIEMFLGNVGASSLVINSASSNITRNLGTTSSNILTAGTCDWVKLYCNGSSWYVMASGKIV